MEFNPTESQSVEGVESWTREELQKKCSELEMKIGKVAEIVEQLSTIEIMSNEKFKEISDTIGKINKITSEEKLVLKTYEIEGIIRIKLRNREKIIDDKNRLKDALESYVGNLNKELDSLKKQEKRWDKSDNIIIDETKKLTGIKRERKIEDNSDGVNKKRRSGDFIFKCGEIGASCVNEIYQALPPKAQVQKKVQTGLKAVRTGLKAVGTGVKMAGTGVKMAGTGVAMAAIAGALVVGVAYVGGFVFVDPAVFATQAAKIGNGFSFFLGGVPSAQLLDVVGSRMESFGGNIESFMQDSPLQKPIEDPSEVDMSVEKENWPKPESEKRQINFSELDKK